LNSRNPANHAGLRPAVVMPSSVRGRPP